jgi:hypothetical protein
MDVDGRANGGCNVGEGKMSEEESRMERESRRV